MTATATEKSDGDDGNDGNGGTNNSLDRSDRLSPVRKYDRITSAAGLPAGVNEKRPSECDDVIR